MSYFKRTWLFWLVVFFLPLVAILISGIYGNYINTQSVNDGVSYYFNGEFIRTLLISISTSLIAAGIVYLFIDKKLRELLAHDEVITVILRTDKGTEKKCPPMSRKDFCRQEVLGYLGMLGGPDRFSLSYTKSKDFGDRILEIQQGKGNDQLVITCTEEELKQFTSDYRESDDITVILRAETGKEVKCPPMPRKDFSRAEVLGYIGMLNGAQRFEIASLKTPKFGENLLKTSKSKGSQPFIVDCTDAEMEQFGAKCENGSNA
ncbi:hypothetical protein [Vibrio cholerae]|uniref:hypothetical protein n=1 Tax=Vibrio cholerae TaxID=666 RepID=UPI0019648760|nr:hypothetical protein [Vibrio cholerae]